MLVSIAVSTWFIVTLSIGTPRIATLPLLRLCMGRQIQCLGNQGAAGFESWRARSHSILGVAARCAPRDRKTGNRPSRPIERFCWSDTRGIDYARANYL